MAAAPVHRLATVVRARLRAVGEPRGTFPRSYLTVAISVAISAFNSLTLSPALSATFLRHRPKGRFVLFRWFNAGFDWLAHSYSRAVRQFIRFGWRWPSSSCSSSAAPTCLSRLLSRLFRRLFLGGLALLHETGRLALFGDLTPLSARGVFDTALAPLPRSRWSTPSRLPRATSSLSRATKDPGRGAQGTPTGRNRPGSSRLKSFVARYWEAVRAGLAFHRALPALKQCAKGRTKRRPGHNLLERLKTYNDVMRFLYDFSVPFTNNLAEQDLRMMKVKMKISGGFRTFEGASRFASLRSVVSTARKRGWNILQTLVSQPNALIRALAA